MSCGAGCMSGAWSGAGACARRPRGAHSGPVPLIAPPRGASLPHPGPGLTSPTLPALTGPSPAGRNCSRAGVAVDSSVAPRGVAGSWRGFGGYTPAEWVVGDTVSLGMWVRGPLPGVPRFSITRPHGERPLRNIYPSIQQTFLSISHGTVPVPGDSEVRCTVSVSPQSLPGSRGDRQGTDLTQETIRATENAGVLVFYLRVTNYPKA